MKQKSPRKEKVDTLKFFSDMHEKSDAKIKGYINIQRAKTDEDIKRYIGIVSEDFQGQVKVISEQYGDITKKLDSHTEMIGRMAEDIEVIKANVEFLKGGMKKKVDYDEFLALERRLSLLESKAKH